MSTRTSAKLPPTRSAAAAVDGLAIGGTLGRDKPEMHRVLEMTAPMLPVQAPKHLLGIGEPDDLLAGIALGIDIFDCAVPTRLARHGTALAPLPESRFRFDLTRAALASEDAPLVEGCPCPICAEHSRAYLHHLSRAEEPTAGRLLTLHNLTFLERLVAGARDGDQGVEIRRLPSADPLGRHPVVLERHPARPDAEAEQEVRGEAADN